MIEMNRASRWHGRVIGLNDVSFRVDNGLTALLGPNGAGKSTLFKMATGQIRPTTGMVKVMGMDPFGNPNVMRKLGYCPEIDNFYEEMTGREFVTLLGSMSGISGAKLKNRVAEVIEQVGMTDRCDRKLGGYSKGMRQRIKIAQAIVHDPQVILLDEPLNGLDPIGRRDVVDLMKTWAAAGKCVLVSSHILYEVEQITDQILVIYRGRVLAEGDIHSLRELIAEHPHHIRVQVDRPRPLAAALIGLPSVLGARVLSDQSRLIEVETSQPGAFYDALSEIVLSDGYVLESLTSPDNNLESVFRYLVERKTA
ncbi:MAG: ABC transporter ATP-binding protein [Armatimonas sp.]